jgi:hypothetical protein
MTLRRSQLDPNIAGRREGLRRAGTQIPSALIDKKYLESAAARLSGGQALRCAISRPRWFPGVFFDRLLDCRLLVRLVINDADAMGWRAADVIDRPRSGCAAA